MELAHGFTGIEGERAPRLELRDQVVIIRTEPLRHLEWFDLWSATGHGEIPVQATTGGAHVRHRVPVAGRDGTEHHGGVEDVVIEGEIITGDLTDTCGLQFGQPLQPQFSGCPQQFAGVDATGPIRFGDFFELSS